MKLLFLCVTEFQLLTALNMKYHLFPDDIVDIIVGNYHGEEAALADRIKQLNWFRYVSYVKFGVENKTLHAYFRGISDGNKTLPLSEALSNTSAFFRSRIGEKIAGPELYLNILIDDFKKLDFTEYDAVYSYGKKPVLMRLFKYLHTINSRCKIIQMDEGIGSYYEINIGGDEVADACALYEPNAKVVSCEAKKIPSISSNDKQFIKSINSVFGFDERCTEDYSNAIVYLDQGIYNVTPKYLRNATTLKKMIFYNAYKRHKREEEDFFTHKRLTEELLDIFSDKAIWIKPHPRSSNDMLADYSSLGTKVKIIPQYQVPWEVIALNSAMDNTLLLTENSSSLFVFPAVIPDKAIGTIGCAVYKLLNNTMSPEFEKSVDKIKNIYPKQIFIPTSREELIDFALRKNTL